MSKKSWKEEFYPISAMQIAMDTLHEPKRSLDRVLLEHSIRKWTGIRPTNLAKHNIRYSLPISVDASSCSLCRVYYTHGNDCDGCPLMTKHGPCDRENGPFQSAMRKNDPEPMIKALKRALKKL